MGKIVITADSGCDLTKAEANRLHVRLIPFHFAIGESNFDDGDIEPDQMLTLCKEQGIAPKTSACTPFDYEVVFNEIRAADPDSEILHLGWSAATTSSFESAKTAAESCGRVICIDTKSACRPYGVIVSKVATFVAENPDATLQEAAAYARRLSDRMRIGFLPSDLDFLHAGGRLTSIESIAAHVLKIKPVVEFINGRMVITRKLRGSLKTACESFLGDFLTREHPEKDEAILLYTPGLPESIRDAVEECISNLGIRDFSWSKAGCITSAHVGGSAFGCAYIADSE